MNEEHLFRTTLIVILVALFPFALYHRLKSQATGEPLDRRQEGIFILATLRPVGLAMLIGVIVYLVDPTLMSWSSIPLPTWVRWGGIGVTVLGDHSPHVDVSSAGTNITDTVVTRRTHSLVTRGPYRWVRHPFYDGVGLLMLGISLAAANWLFLAAGVVLFVLFVIRTRIEEANLLARFGASYRAYMDSTGRFLPKLGAPRNGR